MELVGSGELKLRRQAKQGFPRRNIDYNLLKLIGLFIIAPVGATITITAISAEELGFVDAFESIVVATHVAAIAKREL